MDTPALAPAEASASPLQGPSAPPEASVEASAPSSPTVAPASTPAEASAAEPPPAPVQAPEAWAKAKGTHPVHFAVARAREGWCAGVELTEAAFDTAVLQGRRQVIR